MDTAPILEEAFYPSWHQKGNLGERKQKQLDITLIILFVVLVNITLTKKARKHFSSSVFSAANHIYSGEETIPEPRVCCQFFATRVGHKKSLCSWHDKFITCDWGSTTAPPLPLGLTNDTVALVLNFNYLIDIVLERGQKTCRTIF